MNTIQDTLIELENERCRCLVEQDYEKLKDLLSPHLVHTHTRGNVDGRDSYIDFVSRVIESLELTRENLRVIPLGPDTAVMHGKQVNRARRRGIAEEVTVSAMVTQVWSRVDCEQWRLVAFQATPLGEAPPAVAR